MADLHPTESALLFQEGHPASESELPEPALPEQARPEQALSEAALSEQALSEAALPEHSRSAPVLPSVLPKEFFHLLQPKRLRAHMRRLRQVVHHLQRVETLVNMYIADQETRKEEKKQQNTSLFHVIPPLPPEGGEYRLFYISPAGLRAEQELLQAHQANKPTEVLYLSASILNAYCGLIRNTDMSGADSYNILSSMAEVLHVALRGVQDTEEMLDVMKPVRLSPASTA